MATIRVTPTILRSKANELRDLNERFKSEVTGLTDSENRLANMWEGEARNAFHAEYQKDAEKFNTFYTGINQYIERLIAVADAYDKAESENLSVAQTRKS